MKCSAADLRNDDAWSTSTAWAMSASLTEYTGMCAIWMRAIGPRRAQSSWRPSRSLRICNRLPISGSPGTAGIDATAGARGMLASVAMTATMRAFTHIRNSRSPRG